MGLGRIAILPVHCTDKIILNTSAQNTALYSLTLKKNPSVTFSSALYENATVTPWELLGALLKTGTEAGGLK